MAATLARSVIRRSSLGFLGRFYLPLDWSLVIGILLIQRPLSLKNQRFEIVRLRLDSFGVGAFSARLQMVLRHLTELFLQRQQYRLDVLNPPLLDVVQGLVASFSRDSVGHVLRNLWVGPLGHSTSRVPGPYQCHGNGDSVVEFDVSVRVAVLTLGLQRLQLFVEGFV